MARMARMDAMARMARMARVVRMARVTRVARVVKAARARRLRTRDPGNLLAASVQRGFQFPSELIASLGQLASLPASLPGLDSQVERLPPRVVD